MHFQHGELRIIGDSFSSMSCELLHMVAMVIDQAPMGVLIGEFADAVYTHVAGSL